MISNKEILKGLKEHFKNPQSDLVYKNNFELLIVVILSAQTTDKRVNIVSPALFLKYPTAKDLSSANLEDVKELIKTIGLFKTKAKNIIECSKMLVNRYNSEIPSTMEELTQLAGVGRKTASVILVKAYNTPAVVVDTHVKRVSKRLKITINDDPTKVEKDLMLFFDKKDWCYISMGIVLFGRYICKAKKPDCQNCALAYCCPELSR